MEALGSIWNLAVICASPSTLLSVTFTPSGSTETLLLLSHLVDAPPMITTATSCPGFPLSGVMAPAPGAFFSSPREVRSTVKVAVKGGGAFFCSPWQAQHLPLVSRVQGGGKINRDNASAAIIPGIVTAVSLFKFKNCEID
jgi:hypothetical protein